MPWFGHDNGPLILLPREALPFWEGIETPSGGRIVEAVFRWNSQEISADYDRACDAMEWAEVLPAGFDSWGMVLPEDACAVALLAFEERRDLFAIVQSFLEDADTLSDYQDAFVEASQDQRAWLRWHDGLEVRTGDVLLMHGTSPGNCIKEIPWNQATESFPRDAQVLRVDSGLYRVDQYRIPEGEGEVALFTRFQRYGF